MSTALTSATLTYWREQIDPERELELRIVREGLMQDESHVLIAVTRLHDADRHRITQLGYEIADVGRAGADYGAWLRAVADLMRARMQTGTASHNSATRSPTSGALELTTARGFAPWRI